MTPGIDKYFAELYLRLKEAKPVPVISVAIGDWRPVPRFCHENVDRYTEHQPGRSAVRGWVIGGTDGCEGYLLVAHSVVEEDNKLYDITPQDGEPSGPLSPRWFIRHPGTKETFDTWARQPRYSSHWIHPPL